METNNAIETIKNLKEFLDESYKALETLIEAAENNNATKVLNDYTWSEIAEIAKSGKAQELFKLGDTKVDYMKNGNKIEYRIIGFNHDKDNSITFEATDTYIEMNFSCTEKGVWSVSAIYRYLQNDFFHEVSDDLRENVKSVDKFNLYDCFVSVSKNKFFILSEWEVFGRKIHSFGKEGKWYDYYKQEGVNYGFDRPRWLRSRAYSNPNDVCHVRPNGNADCYHYNVARGLVPAFCI